MPPAVRSPLGAGAQSIPRRRGELRSFEWLQLGGLQSAYAKMVKDVLNLIDADVPGRDDLDPERRATLGVVDQESSEEDAAEGSESRRRGARRSHTGIACSSRGPANQACE